MSVKLTPSDFCESCLKIACSNGGKNTVREMLLSQGFEHPMGNLDISYTILANLERMGGCSSCINTLKRAIAAS